MRAVKNLDAVLFLGDYIYECPARKNAVRVPTGGWVYTLDDYRQRYALYKLDADLQAMHATCPWLVTSGVPTMRCRTTTAGATEATVASRLWILQACRAAAYQAFYAHMPLFVHRCSRERSRDSGATPKCAFTPP